MRDGGLACRAYDVAGCTRGVKVYLNGKRLPVKGFKDYVGLFLKDKEDEAGNPLTVVYESPSDRWEVAVTLSEAGEFRQMSFVNSIATTKGGSHVDYIAEQLTKKVSGGTAVRTPAVAASAVVPPPGRICPYAFATLPATYRGDEQKMPQGHQFEMQFRQTSCGWGGVYSVLSLPSDLSHCVRRAGVCWT